MSLAWEAVGATDRGRVRRSNEDAFRVDAARGVFLVADGMGGHAAGEVASELTSQTTARLLAQALDAGAPGAEIPELLRAAVRQSHQELVRVCQAEPDTRGMGTTLTVCVLDPSGVARLGHIGDSRCYRMRGASLEQVTRDHTWVQREVDAGRLTPEAARTHPLSHILTRVLTEDLEPELDLLATDLWAGDLLLLATDGLYNMVDDATLARLLSADTPLAERAQSLVQAANAAGGTDNVTVVLVQLREG